MMTVEVFDGLGSTPINVPATQVLVRDDHGNPLMFAADRGQGLCRVCRVGDDDFQQTLAEYGVDRFEMDVRHVDARRL